MMLRASIESTAAASGTNTPETSTLSDLSGLAKGSTAAGSPVRGAAVLIAFVDATAAVLERPAAGGRAGPGGVADPDFRLDRALDRTFEDGPEKALEEAREAVRAALGEAALVDAAAIIGNFERMVRIADGTGIPLDTPVHVATESIRASLGLDRFEAAARERPVKRWQRGLRRLLEPIVTFALRRRARRAGIERARRAGRSIPAGRGSKIR